MITQQNSRRLNPMLLGNLDHRLSAGHRATGASKRRVRHDVDALLLAKVDNVLLGKLRVVLDLVDGWDDGGVREEFFEVTLAVLFIVWFSVRLGRY